MQVTRPLRLRHLILCGRTTPDKNRGQHAATTAAGCRTPLPALLPNAVTNSYCYC
jgi:hypothetical protein